MSSELSEREALKSLLLYINENTEDKAVPGELLWDCVRAYEGHEFRTTGRGKNHTGAVSFTYRIKISSRTGKQTDELVISTREAGKTITRSSVELAFKNAIRVQGEMSFVKGPRSIGEIFGRSYLYAMFLEWGIITAKPV